MSKQQRRDEPGKKAPDRLTAWLPVADWQKLGDILDAMAIVAIIYSGAYNIGTSNHDNALVNWALDTGMTRAVEQHAKGIQATSLTDPALVQKGAQLYGQMCVFCLGAPGAPPKAIAKGLWPDAPNLVKTVPE